MTDIAAGLTQLLSGNSPVREEPPQFPMPLEGQVTSVSGDGTAQVTLSDYSSTTFFTVTLPDGLTPTVGSTCLVIFAKGSASHGWLIAWTSRR